MPWLDVFSILIIAVSTQLLLINIQSNGVMVAFNIIAIASITAIQVFYALLDFTK